MYMEIHKDKNGGDCLTLCDLLKCLPPSNVRYFALDVMNKESSKRLLQSMQAELWYYSQ